MTLLDVRRRINAVFQTFLFCSTFPGFHCELTVSPAGPTLVNAVAGSNVTLDVSFSGALDPAVTWFMGNLPVVTWTITSSAPPDIADNRRNVLALEQNGSLTFMNVPPAEYNNNYTFEITKSGLGKASTTFTLRVFEILQNVTLSAEPDVAIEGTDLLTLEYGMLQGVVEQQTWFFNGMEIKTSSKYSVKISSLEIFGLTRGDTGQYSVLLTNPFSRVATHINVTVLYGPDQPILVAQPSQPFYVAGDSLNLSCQADGYPKPTVQWVFGGQNISQLEVLNLTNVLTSQSSVYECILRNERTKKESQKNITLNVYEKPSGDPLCSVQSVNNNTDLQYLCQWLGGTPQALLYFPVLSNSSGLGIFARTITAPEKIDGKIVTCLAEHPTERNECNITANSPVKFLPIVRTTVNSEGKIVVNIQCVTEASPSAVVSWSRGNGIVANETTHLISNDTTQIQIQDFNVSNFLQQNYACTCTNPLGSQRREIQLLGPSISNSSLFPNQDGTIVRLTWEVPQYSLVTGFDIQMEGPELLTNKHNNTQTKGSSNKFQTIKKKPGSARHADIFFLDPKSMYRFRVIPIARMTEGEPSKVQRIGPGEGLSGPAIAGIAAGIPCSILFLILLAGLIFFCVRLHKNRSRQTRYPVSRAVDKAITTHIDSTPHNHLAGGLKAPPDYNRFQLAPSERSMTPPPFVPPVPVRVATTV